VSYEQPPLVDRLREVGVPLTIEAAEQLELLSATVAAQAQAEPAPIQFDPVLWCRAEREMEPYHAQVQGFFYPDYPEVLGTVEVDGIEDVTFDETSEPDGEHVVVDHTLPPQVERVKWRKRGPYDETHVEMMEAIRVHQTRMTFAHYMLLLTRGD